MGGAPLLRRCWRGAARTAAERLRDEAWPTVAVADVGQTPHRLAETIAQWEVLSCAAKTLPRFLPLLGSTRVLNRRLWCARYLAYCADDAHVQRRHPPALARDEQSRGRLLPRCTAAKAWPLGTEKGRRESSHPEESRPQHLRGEALWGRRGGVGARCLRCLGGYGLG